MKFAVFTVSTPDYTPDDAVTVLSDLGYDGVEWRVTDQAESADGNPGFWAGNRCTWPLATFEQDAPRIKAMTEAAGLEMPGLGTYPTCDNLVDVEKAMRGAVALGVSQLRVNVPNYDGISPYLALRDRSFGQYREVAAMARGHCCEIGKIGEVAYTPRPARPDRIQLCGQTPLSGAQHAVCRGQSRRRHHERRGRFDVVAARMDRVPAQW